MAEYALRAILPPGWIVRTQALVPGTTAAPLAFPQRRIVVADLLV